MNADGNLPESGGNESKDYEYGVQWQSRVGGRKLDVDEWFPTFPQAQIERDQTEQHLTADGKRASRFAFVVVRRRKAGPVETMLPEKCAENECRPDRLGYCVDCGHEMVREPNE